MSNSKACNQISASLISILVILCLANPFVAKASEEYATPLECYPDQIQARLEARDRAFREQAPWNDSNSSLFYFIDTSKKWVPGQSVTVAFSGGTPSLIKQLSDQVNEWTRYGNIKFDFGYDASSGDYRRWSPSDTAYTAQIRVSFNQPGYWSAIGNDSVNTALFTPSDASLNLHNFDKNLPFDWRGVALHEFGHALGFEHEHQRPADGCDADFRFEDDAGYQQTTDSYGQFIADSEGRRPGIYTVLGGPPNWWPKAKVDFNLRQRPASSAYVFGPFDASSIMKYYFPVWMFVRGQQSHCYSGAENLVLSDYDKKGIARVYPSNTLAVTDLLMMREKSIDTLLNFDLLQPPLKRILEKQKMMLKNYLQR